MNIKKETRFNLRDSITFRRTILSRQKTIWEMDIVYTYKKP